MEIRKSSIEQAKADFNEIKDFAMKQAVKEIENKIAPKLDEVINAALNESVSIEAGEVKVEVPTGENITISKEDGSSITISGDGSETVPAEIDPIAVDPIETPSDEISIGDEVAVEDEDEIEVDMDGDGEDDSDDEITVDDTEEIENNEDEMNNIEEADETIEVPAAEQTQDNNMETPQEITQNPFDVIMQRLDSIENKLDGGAPVDAVSDEVEIVDDEAAIADPSLPADPALAADPAAVPAPAEEENVPVQEEFVLEGGDEEFDIEFGEEKPGDGGSSVNMGDYAGLDEEEIVAEIIDELGEGLYGDEHPEGNPLEAGDEEESLEEMLGVSATVKHQAGRRNELNENKKAQYESKIGELIKENAGLKDTIKEYQASFVELRKQFNEMQTFNTKLAYTNKIFTNGGYSQEEKERIAEQFDQAKTMEDAKDLFKKIMKESTTVVTKKNADDKIKSKTISVNSNPQPLYESEQVKRWKKLGGVDKNLTEE